LDSETKIKENVLAQLQTIEGLIE